MFFWICDHKKNFCHFCFLAKSGKFEVWIKTYSWIKTHLQRLVASTVVASTVVASTVVAAAVGGASAASGALT